MDVRHKRFAATPVKQIAHLTIKEVADDTNALEKAGQNLLSLTSLGRHVRDFVGDGSDAFGVAVAYHSSQVSWNGQGEGKYFNEG